MVAIIRRSLLAVLSFVFMAQPLISQDKNWTHFRGSNLNGISSADNIPLNWDESSIAWRTEIPGKGHSSPVVYDNQIWITTATADGKELHALCTDFLTGKTIHNIKVFTPEETIRKHSINTYASPTPCMRASTVLLQHSERSIYHPACPRMNCRQRLHVRLRH